MLPTVASSFGVLPLATMRAAIAATAAARALHSSSRACAPVKIDGVERKIAVVALGGNALLKRGEDMTDENQRKNARIAAEALAKLISEENLVLCVTHGNGTQVGLLALKDPETTLDVLGSESEGQIGYHIETELAGQLPAEHKVAAVLTQTLVDSKDPAFQNPTKFIGKVYPKEEADRLMHEKKWAMKADGNYGYRRVVASPKPLDILESRPVEVLLHNGVTTICCGGGGIPVSIEADGRTRTGVECVVDKDAASALLAKKIKADIFLVLTDAEAVYDPAGWPDKKEHLPSPMRASELEKMKFPAGSMGPKVESVCDFVSSTGGLGGIGSLGDALDIIRGKKGTLITQ